jgi:hypothetical protein
MFAQLYDATSSAAVSGSEVSTSSTSWSLQRSGSISLTTGHKYKIQLHASGNSANGSIANAHVILDQNDSNGITAFETYQYQINRQVSTNSATAVQSLFLNKFDDSNFGGTGTYNFEATLKGGNKGSQVQTGHIRLRNNDDSETVTSTPADLSATNATVVWTRTTSNLTVGTNSGNLKTQKQYDSEYWCTTTGTSCTQDATNNGGGSGTYIFDTALVIRISSMPVPEASLVLLPVIIFVPYTIKKIRERRKRQKQVSVEVTNAY